MHPAQPVILQTKNIVKNFNGVYALKGVNFELIENSGLALVGENGAGKSTLMKILSGVYADNSFEGQIFLRGKNVHFGQTSDAEKEGIIIIHQELNLFAELTVSENIFLSHLPKNKLGLIDYKKMNDQANELLSQLEVSFTAEDRLGDLNPGEQQMVEIAKALSKKARILILDEPTSSLTQKETEVLFRVLKKLQAQGLSFIYISHKLEEVYELCSHVTVLRDGESVFQGQLRDVPAEKIIEYMVGREIKNLYPPLKIPQEESATEKAILEVKNWSAFKKTEGKWRVRNLSFKAYRGEILGISGMMGAGRSDLLLSLFGHEKYKTQGEVYFHGQPIHQELTSPLKAKEKGFALVTEDRKKSGLHLEQTVVENLTLSSLTHYQTQGRLNKTLMEQKAHELIEKLKIKVSSQHQQVKNLSGGNQQKIAIGKWLATSPQVLFLDEPTRGIDVGAKFEIYSLLNELVDLGLVVIVASSELPEILGICHRVLVIREGQLVRVLTGEERSNEKIMQAATMGS